MLRRVNKLYSICFAFGLSILLILAGSRGTDNTRYHGLSEGRRSLRNFLKNDDRYEDVLQSFATGLYNSSNIELILDTARLQIKQEMSNYNLSHSGVNKLEDLLIESGGQPLRSLIISTWRSGTTFLGDILNSVPSNYYHYEPFLKYDIIQIRGTPQGPEAVNVVKKMLKCNFEGMDDYFEYGKNHLYQFSHNTRLWNLCKVVKEWCFDANFTSRFCKLFPFQSMKVVRLRLHLVEEILLDKQLNLKVLLLVRDPRAVLQSRQHRHFCQPAPDCWSPELLCADMISDYVAASKLMINFPNRIMVVRYEELALQPFETTQQIFDFLGLSVTPSVQEFLSTHTTYEMAGVSSTYRISQEVPFKWKNVMDFDYVDTIQTTCKEAMDLWGYQLAYNASHMASKDFYPLQKYKVSL